MARWKVTAKHYVHAEQYGQPTEWERQETNVQTGRMFRKTYKVPMFIDPDDPFCVNKFEGICVVARAGTEKPGDIVFTGPPTPDMEPLDADAQAETDEHKHKWINPIDSLAPEIGGDFGKQILALLERQLDAAGRPQPAVSLAGASSADIESLKSIVAKQQEMINQLMSRAGPEPTATPEEIPPGEGPVEFDDKLPPDGDPAVTVPRPPIPAPRIRR
jgi:hypothetical protein